MPSAFRSIIVVAVLMVGILNLHAQTPEPAAGQDTTVQASTEKKSEPRGGTAFGIKGMIGFGLPSYENLPDGATSETSTSWSIGAFFNWSGRGVISLGLQPELLYVSESGQNTFSAIVGGQEIVTETQINSLRLPVLVKLQFFDPLVVQPSIYLGPSFSYILSAQNTVNGTDYTLEPESAFQVGLAAGIDVTILSFLVADVRYNTKFNSFEAVTEGQTLNLTMSSLRVGLGLRF